MNKAACIILINNNGQILGVSRKNNLNDMNLPAGKMESSDPSIEYTAIRETLEETGIKVNSLREIDNRIYRNYIQHCFIGLSFEGEISYDKIKEPHEVKWTTPEELINGSFGEYNKEMFLKAGIKC